jgi:hypothetical protein
MPQTLSTAREVAEILMERSRRALLDNDYEEFLQCFALPVEIETFDGRRWLKTPEHVRVLFDSIRFHHRRTGVTDAVQHVVEAVFKDPATVAATHETRLLNKNVLTQKPYPVFSLLIQGEQCWQIKSMTFAIEDQTDHNKALMTAGDKHETTYPS